MPIGINPYTSILDQLPRHYVLEFIWVDCWGPEPYTGWRNFKVSVRMPNGQLVHYRTRKGS